MRYSKLLLSVIVVFAIVLTGCESASAPAEAPQEEAAMAEDEVVTITWWLETGTPQDWWQEHLIDAFEEANPGIKIEAQIQENIQDVLRTAILGGEAPDILTTFSPGWNAPYIEAGHMAVLDTFAEQWGWEDKLQTWAFEAGRVDDKLYSIPLSYESIVILYNKTLFDEMNWEQPTSLVELETLAGTIEAEGIHPFAYGNKDAFWNNGHLMTGYINNAMKLADLKAMLEGEKAWTSPEMVNAIELFNRHIVDNSWWSGGLENYYQYESADFYGELANREAAMVMVGTWGFGSVGEFFAEVDDEWDWFPVPSMIEGQEYNYTLGIGSSLAINSASEGIEEAALFFDFLISDPARVVTLAAADNYSQIVPVRLSLDDLPEDIDPRVGRFHADFAEVTTAGRYGYTNYTFWPASANNHLRQEIEGVWEGLYSLEEYLQAHQDMWEELRANNETIPIP
ncbi:extracellular solute-binding protein [Chloroflexi bacterium TSY]|nr:extracellular solute-binding protein [Chloroflexi bacterium TSY]